MKKFYVLALSALLIISGFWCSETNARSMDCKPESFTTNFEIITPTFNLLSAYCENSLPVLPSTSIEGITGTWLPAQVTITGDYVFTPNPGQNSSAVSVLILIVPTIATFSNLPTSYCQNATPAILPVLSSNAVIGTWSPEVIDTSTPGTQNYIFTSLCGTYILTVTVNPTIIPVFSFPTYICNGATPPVLPLTSDNGIPGTWTPSSVSLNAGGDYLFTPSSGCSTNTSVHISLTAECVFVFTYGNGVECEFGVPGRKYDTTILNGDCIKVCGGRTLTYSINGDMNLVNYINWSVTGGTIIGTPTNAIVVQWDDTTTNGTISGSIVLTSGVYVPIMKCIEKVEPPLALFGVVPDLGATTYQACQRQLVYFTNLSTSNAGIDNMYYLWDFGDGTTSTETNPAHAFTQMGVYSVSLTVFSGCSCLGRYAMTIDVDKVGLDIICPGVACEGGFSTYSVRTLLSCDLDWDVTGGHIVGYANNNQEVRVVWDNVSPSGYGVVSLTSSCSPCVSRIKVPIVQQHGTITGNPDLCADSQRIYSLPQWPSTFYQWSIVDPSGTGASIQLYHQSNQIIVQAGGAGVVKLKCSYNNTLLGCSGTSELDLQILPAISIGGNELVCAQTLQTYYFLDEDGAQIGQVAWTIRGPDNFLTSGNSTNAQVTFPVAGIYTFELGSSGYCPTPFSVTVTPALAAPIYFDGDVLACPGRPAVYSCNPPQGAIANWTVQNGTIAGGNSNGSEIAVNFNANPTGDYVVTLQYVQGECSSPPYSRIIPRDVPNVTFLTGSETVCGSSLEQYSINDVNAETITWSIEPAAAGSVSSGQNSTEVAIQWNQASLAGVIIRVAVRKCGATYDQFTKMVDIIDTPIINFSAPTTACATTNVFSASTNEISVTSSLSNNDTWSSIVWNFGDGSPLVVQTHGPMFNNTVTHNYFSMASLSTTLTITLTVYGLNGCPNPAIATHNIEVYPAPVISISPSGNVVFCNTVSIPFTLNILTGFGNTNTSTIKWFRRPVGSSIFTELSTFQGNTTYTATMAGTYYAQVSNDHCTSKTRRINISEQCGGGGNIICSTFAGPVGIKTEGCQSIQVVADPSINPDNISWAYNFSDATIESQNSTFYATNITPGGYMVQLSEQHIEGGVPCYTKTDFPFVIPYRAGIVYKATCGISGGYSVDLLNQSEIYPLIQPGISYQFSVDGGLWIDAMIDITTGAQHYPTNLAPGPHTLGIKLSHPDYADCIKTVVLDLPNYPTAAFTYQIACANAATHFMASDPENGNTFEWTFVDNTVSNNTQRNPYKTFQTASPLVKLKVTNIFGCFEETTQTINLIPVGISGAITVSPAEACQGGTINLGYDIADGAEPAIIKWYKNSINNLVATTVAPTIVAPAGHNIQVTESGNYFVYAYNAAGCIYTDSKPKTATFAPLPTSPQISGPSTVCEGSSIVLSVPVNPSVEYEWTLAGSVVSTTNTVTEPNVGLGDYTFSVTATNILTGLACTSLPAIFTVHVAPPPQSPNLSISVGSCDPYEVRVSVDDPQPGEVYYWSNGEVGEVVYVFHDGPLQVTAVAGECTATTHVDLPLDLNTLAWTFPAGCFSFCKDDFNPTIIGPIGNFAHWAWIIDGNTGTQPPLSGVDAIEPLTNLSAPRSYALVLQTAECEKTLGTLNLNRLDECADCDLTMDFKKIRAIELPDHTCFYEVTYVMANPTQDTYYYSFTAANGSGLLSPSSVTLLPNSAAADYVFVFVPSPSMIGTSVTIYVEGHTARGAVCDLKRTFQLPPCVSGEGTARILVGDEKTDVLMLAPNPAAQVTTVYYSFAERALHRTIDVIDLMGRTLTTVALKDQNGEAELDLSRYAQGNYMVVMKENGRVLKTTKLAVGK